MCGVRRGKFVVTAAVLLTAVGCMNHPHGGYFGTPPMPFNANAHIQVPPDDAVPRELKKITLPPYVIEAPDQLLIEVVRRARVPDLDEKGNPKKNLVTGEPLEKDVVIGLDIQNISGPFQVRHDGTVSLGFWGSVPVSGLSLDGAAQAIRDHLAQHPELKKLGIKAETIVPIVDVIAYNSKRYYIITDGGGFGEQVFPFPITGSETVLDAIGNINGLPDVASKRNIWVARRTPHPGQPWQILPVDWVGISQHGHTFTNYQVLPGDRIYVKAQRLVTIDRTLARVFSPVERVFGITLLGTSTVNQITGRGLGFGGNQ